MSPGVRRDVAVPSRSISRAFLSEHAPVQADDHPQALVMVIGGIGGLDWCGLALRQLLRKKRPPYAVRLVSWGLGFGRWHADLTNATIAMRTPG